MPLPRHMLSDDCLHITQRSSCFPCIHPHPFVAIVHEFIYVPTSSYFSHTKWITGTVPEILSSLSFNASPEWSCNVAAAHFQFVPSWKMTCYICKFLLSSCKVVEALYSAPGNTSLIHLLGNIEGCHHWRVQSKIMFCSSSLLCCKQPRCP